MAASDLETSVPSGTRPDLKHEALLSTFAQTVLKCFDKPSSGFIVSAHFFFPFFFPAFETGGKEAAFTVGTGDFLGAAPSFPSANTEDGAFGDGRFNTCSFSFRTGFTAAFLAFDGKAIKGNRAETSSGET